MTENAIRLQLHLDGRMPRETRPGRAAQCIDNPLYETSRYRFAAGP